MDTSGKSAHVLGRAAEPAGASLPMLACERLSVSLEGRSGRTAVLDGVDLTIPSGEFVSILGASGTGKTTLLRVLAGLQPVSSGDVRHLGTVVNGPPRGVIAVFQNYAQSLLQWRTVERNVALGIESRLSKQECRERVARALDLVGLRASAREYPWALSGGMQQRVQIARALAMDPSVLLMDEPFGALDAMTKGSLQDQLLEVHSLTKATIVFITHDVDEAVYLSDRVIVLSGRPANIALDVRVELPRPRQQVTTRESSEYLRLRHQVYAALGVVDGRA